MIHSKALEITSANEDKEILPSPTEGMATHSRTLAWRIPWTEEPGGLRSIGSQRVGHD